MMRDGGLRIVSEADLVTRTWRHVRVFGWLFVVANGVKQLRTVILKNRRCARGCG